MSNCEYIDGKCESSRCDCNMKHKASLFITWVPWKPITIRLNIPGIDRGGAVQFDAELDLPMEGVRALIPKIEEALKDVKFYEE